VESIHPDFDPVLEQLFSLYVELDSKHLAGRYEGLDRLARGWYLHVERGCASVLLLSGNGLQFETAPIRRSIVEHTLALKWLRFDAQEVVVTVGRAGVESLRRLDIAHGKAGLERIAEEELKAMRAIADSVDKSNDQYINFTQRAEKLNGHAEKAAFLNETLFAHPSMVSAMIFFEPTDRFDRYDQATFCSLWMLYALEHLNNMFQPAPWPGLITTMSPRITAATKAGAARR
jgi:hypothetical protein